MMHLTNLSSKAKTESTNDTDTLDVIQTKQIFWTLTYNEWRLKIKNWIVPEGYLDRSYSTPGKQSCKLTRRESWMLLLHEHSEELGTRNDRSENFVPFDHRPLSCSTTTVLMIFCPSPASSSNPINISVTITPCIMLAGANQIDRANGPNRIKKTSIPRPGQMFKNDLIACAPELEKWDH